MKSRLLPAAALAAALLPLAVGGPAGAGPAMAGGEAGMDKFARMDTDGNGALSREEFKAAIPNIRDEAFAAIDENGDQAIGRDEWLAFLRGHAAGTLGPKSGQGRDTTGDGAGCPAPPPHGTPPLVTPPADGK